MRALVLATIALASCTDESIECPPGTMPIWVDARETELACRRPNGELDGPVFVIVDGGARQVGQWRDNKQFGVWEYRHYDGAPSAIVSYRDGIADGPSTFYTRDGHVMLRARWVAGFADGIVRYTTREQTVQRQFSFGRRSGIWELPDGRLSRTYAFDGTLLVYDGRAVPPPPQQIRLPDGRWLARSECNLATWDTGFASPCLDLFEALQYCETAVCRDIVMTGYLMEPSPVAFWKGLL